jgi:hypothetical protein
MDKDILTITESDKVLINRLLPSSQLSNAIRKFRESRYDKSQEKQKNISIDDLSIEQIKDIIPKIDVYVDEIYEFRKAVGNYDEAWIFEYDILKNRLKERLEEFKLLEIYKRSRVNGIEMKMAIQTMEDLKE